MRIKVTKISDCMNEATGFTVWENSMNVNREKAFRSEHSIIRSVLFKVEMYDIFRFVSTHLVRHSATGELHYVSSQREDRGYKGDSGRRSLVNHLMILNAQHLITIARWRLCKKASPETSEVVEAIMSQAKEIEPALTPMLVPRCVDLGECREFKSCGYFERWKRRKER